MECGRDVMDHRVGDEVFGAVDPWTGNGTWTTHLWVHEGDVARKPRTMTHEQAAAIPFAVMTVWRSVIEHALEKRPQRALIMGRGNVGSTTARLLKHMCHVPEVDLVGSAQVPSISGPPYDLVVDATDNRGVPLFVPHLVASGGRFVTFNGVLLSRITQQGFLDGSWSALAELLEQKRFLWAERGATYHWGIMRAGGARALEQIARRIDGGSLPWDEWENLHVLRGGLEQVVDEWNRSTWHQRTKCVISIKT